MRTRTYYQGPDAVVTDDQFVWRTTPVALNFAVQHLRNVGVVQTPARVRSFAPHLAAGILFTSAAAWTLLADPTLYVFGFLAVASPAVAVVWRQPRRWELHAQYHGTAVVLYSSSDVRVFNQVGRALRRAMEDGRPTAWGYGLAAA
ncbi:DUF6232 family protein [Actinoplanes sp. NPDC051851]|uniref:DUF6232 family protein n=1 Tax=Actinoplanes sp. NPDC051851 TaxID=3154753 RepID=UPI0034407A03